MVTSKTTKTEDESEQKVFDVAKPGSSSPETGTKPMVIGHKTLPSDPSMINQDDASVEKNEDVASDLEPAIGLSPSSKKLRLRPLSEAEKNGTPIDAEDQEDEDDISTPSDQESSEVKETEVDDEDTETKVAAQKTPSELEKDLQNVVDEREGKLRELIKSGEYNVSINESKGFNVKVFILTFIVVGTLIMVILAVLIDLEILDSGITLPFDVL